MEYRIQVTTFDPAPYSERKRFEAYSEVAAIVKSIPPLDAAVVVEAVANGVDYGNFYLFLNNEGLAHIMLHEHRELFARDASSNASRKSVTFHYEDGSAFNVEPTLVTSVARGKAALEYWLPSQAQSPEFTWQ